jgi:hypothetical protein
LDSGCQRNAAQPIGSEDGGDTESASAKSTLEGLFAHHGPASASVAAVRGAAAAAASGGGCGLFRHHGPAAASVDYQVED